MECTDDHSLNFRYVTNKIVLRLLITFSGAVRKMFRTRVIFGETMDNYLSMEKLRNV